MDQPPALNSDILSNAELCSRLQSVLTTVLPTSSSSITRSSETEINLKIDGLFQPVTIAVSIGAEEYLTVTAGPVCVFSNRLSAGNDLVLKRDGQIIEFRGGNIDEDHYPPSDDIWWDVVHDKQQHFIDLVQGLAEVALEYLESEKLCLRLMREMGRVFPAAVLTPTLTGVALDFGCNADETHIRVMLRNEGDDVGVVFWPPDVFEAAFGDDESPDDEHSATLTFPVDAADESFTIYRQYMELCTDDLGEDRWWFYKYDGNPDKLVAFATGMARVANDYFGIDAADVSE